MSSFTEWGDLHPRNEKFAKVYTFDNSNEKDASCTHFFRETLFVFYSENNIRYFSHEDLENIFAVCKKEVEKPSLRKGCSSIRMESCEVVGKIDNKIFVLVKSSPLYERDGKMISMSEIMKEVPR